MNDQNSTGRFSNRVEDYKRYRPSYPEAIVAYLEQKEGLLAQSVIADIGAGTGISSRLFLEQGYPVIAVEPNAAMRQAAEKDLQHFEAFRTQDGTAENTGLEAHSIDALVAAQAFHWFDKDAVKKEFRRILKPGGLVVLIWNERQVQTDFEREYDQLILDYAIDYVQVRHRNIDYESIKAFFAPQTCSRQLFTNQQTFNFEGLKGRLLSSSYIPKEDHPRYEAMITDLHNLFERHQVDNSIRIHYETQVYTGKLS